MKDLASLIKSLGVSPRVDVVNSPVAPPDRKSDPVGYEEYRQPHNVHLRRRRHHVVRLTPVSVQGEPGKDMRVTQTVGEPPVYERRIDAEHMDYDEMRRAELDAMIEYARTKGKLPRATDSDIEGERAAVLDRRLAELAAVNAREDAERAGRSGAADVGCVPIDEAPDWMLDDLVRQHKITVGARAGRKAKITALKNHGIDSTPATAVSGGGA